MSYALPSSAVAFALQEPPASLILPMNATRALDERTEGRIFCLIKYILDFHEC